MSLWIAFLLMWFGASLLLFLGFLVAVIYGNKHEGEPELPKPVVRDVEFLDTEWVIAQCEWMEWIEDLPESTKR